MDGLVGAVLSSATPEKEVISLQQLVTNLGTKHEDKQGICIPKSDNSLENEFLELESSIEDDPFPEFRPETLCSDQDELNRFCYYVFDRRFGWSEQDKEDGRRVRRLSSTGVVVSDTDGHQKAILNTHLDSLLKWFLHQDLDQSMLHALKFTIQKACHTPVVRNRTVIHMMDFLKKNSDSLSDDNSYIAVIQELIQLSLMDVWSAIRNACASRLGNLIQAFSLDDVQMVFTSLVRVCCVEEGSWQSKEGAIMGINAILQRFLHSSTSKSPMPSPRGLSYDADSGGANDVPEFISKEIHAVVFTLLSHSQLTIREHAAKSLATYITCSSIVDALTTLNEVVATLSKGCESQTERAGKVSVKFFDDYAAEGFLGVCIFLVKVLPLSSLLPGWPQYVSTFIQYISHPASTVRQAASNVFKYLVVKSSHCVVVLKLILQALAMGWNPDTELMTEVISPDETMPGHSCPSVRDNTGCSLSDTWEGREGRLFAYELIFKYLIKNHWLYTFGPAGSGLGGEERTNRDVFEKQNPEQNGEHTQSNSRINTSVVKNDISKPMHHVESEKSLAVKFLTQAELRVSSIQEQTEQVWQRKKSLDRVSVMANREDGYLPLKSRYSPTCVSRQETTFSLLTQAQVVDTSPLQVPEAEVAHVRQQLQLQDLRKIVEANKNSKLGCKCLWVEKEYLQDMARILKVILYQTAESVSHGQWELRRIANQVLPCLAEVIRWYDVNILVAIWNSYLYPYAPTCLMTFTSVLLLKESMVHAVHLLPLLQKPPHSWQDHERCHDCLSVITSCIQSRLSHYLPYMVELVERPSCDRLSVHAADIILMSYEHFSIPAEKKSSQYSSVHGLWKRVFYFAHPNTRISTSLLETEMKQLTFSSPFEGYLSCCLVRPDSKVQCARQVEKQFVFEVHNKLLPFLQTLLPGELLTVYPIVAHYVGLFIDESYISKTVLECLNSLAEVITELVTEETDAQTKRLYLQSIHVTLKELAALVTIKSIEPPQTQKVLFVYQELSKLIKPSRHLQVIFTAISARLNETVQFSIEHSPRPGHDDDDLLFLDNDIPTSFSIETNSDSDSEEVIIGTPNRFPESLTLNTSNNSGSLPSGRLSALSSHSNEGAHVTLKGSPDSDDEDSSSDWDSWDEEDESQSAFSGIFSEFLKTLQKSLNTGGSEFLAEVKKLGDEERTVILGLLKT